MTIANRCGQFNTQPFSKSDLPLNKCSNTHHSKGISYGRSSFVVSHALFVHCVHQHLHAIWHRKETNRPYYSCVHSCHAFDLEWGWRWPCCNRDQYLVSITTRQFTFEKQQGLYHNKVTLSLTPVKRLGNQVRNCKMDYSPLTVPL